MGKCFLYHRGSIKGIKIHFLAIIAIACLFVLINPTQGTFNIIINSKYPTPFLEDEDVVLDWNYNYEKQLDSYTISVKEYGTNVEIWHSKKSLNDKFQGEHSPVIGASNLGKRKAGIYVVELRSVSSDPKIEGDSVSEFLKVSKAMGNLLINTYYDANENGNRDPTEGIAGIRFRIGITGEPRLEYEKATNDSGMLSVPLGVGQYIIEEIPKSGWDIVEDASKDVNIVKGQTTLAEFKNVQTKPPTTKGVEEKLFWKLILILFYISLAFCAIYKQRIYSKKAPLPLNLLIMIIIYGLLIQLTKLAGLDPYENYIIMAVGFILIAPVLHKLSEFLIVEFLAKYTVGAGVAGLLNYLNIINILSIPAGEPTPLGEMNLFLRILFVIAGLIFSLILGYIADTSYEYLKYKLNIADIQGKLFLIITLLLVGLFMEPHEQPLKPEISELVTDLPNIQENSTIVLTANVKNPGDVNILYRFFLNDKSVTDWTRLNQWIWTITDANVGETKVEVRIKDAGITGDDVIYDAKYILMNIQNFNKDNGRNIKE